MTMVTINAHDGGAFDAYLATPANLTDKTPAIIVVQEIFGVNNDVRKKCDDWAAKGYLAIAPDLFWRQQPGVQLNTLDEAEWKQAFGYLQGFDVDLGVDDIKSTLAYMRGQPNCTGAVGTVGYCLGGRLTYLMATRSDATCNVSFYGVTIENYLNEAANIKQPLLMHLAEEDKYVSRDAQEQIKQAVSTNPQVAVYSYPGMDHAFTRLNGGHYNEAAATLANGRTADFFEKNLRQKAVAAA